MAIEQILPNVYRIGMGYVSAYLIAQDEVTIIDTGLPKHWDTLANALSQAGREPKDLRHVAITHDHVDHTGSAAAVFENTQAAIYIHPLDAPVLRGERPQRGPNQQTLFNRVLGSIIHRVAHPELNPVQQLHEINDGDDLPAAGGMKAIHTPGHTPGHLAYLWHHDGGVLFAGDAAAHVLGLGPPVGIVGGIFSEDMAAAKDSFRKLAGLEFDVACFGHGGVLKGKAHSAFRRTVEKMAK